MLRLFTIKEWVLSRALLVILPIMLAGLATMSGIGNESAEFWKQLVWISISLCAFLIISNLNFKNLNKSNTSLYIYIFGNVMLIILFILGKVTNGAQSWLHIGGISFQPADLMKLGLIMLLAKYFSRRHVEIADAKHLFISGLYLLIPFVLVLLQPDLGSALILLFIWGGMVLCSGASRKHVLVIVLLGILSFILAWNFAFKPYQKARIVNFLNPLSDIRGTGYNAYQSTIAVGNGGAWGQGLGYGSQSRLNYLPEHQTDFIFAAFAEEWGFMGAATLALLYVILLSYMMYAIYSTENNYIVLFTTGIIIWFYSHIMINIGMNLGVSPVTGIPLPFMSYGGSHLLLESIAIAMAASMIKK